MAVQRLASVAKSASFIDSELGSASVVRPPGPHDYAARDSLLHKQADSSSLWSPWTRLRLLTKPLASYLKMRLLGSKLRRLG